MNVLEALSRLTGLTLTRSSVEHAVKRRMAALGIDSRQAYAGAIDEAELQRLVDLVVVPESWLFRDPQAFVAATAFVRQRLADGARQVRILSVPCAGGEEPYSIAMALCDAGIPPPSFAIDALDVSAACIARAQAGVYGRNAFRAQDLSFRDRYFVAEGTHAYRINDAMRACIRFSQGSILEGELGSAPLYDVIFCRNLLIYFDDATTTSAIARLSAHLADDGMLLAGYAEVPSFMRHGFAALPHRQAFALRKDIHRSGPPAQPALPLRQPRPARATPPASSGAGAASAAGAPAARRAAAPGRASTAPQRESADDSLLAHARKLADSGQLLEAESACREYLAQQPESAEAYFILGLLAETARQPAEAETHLKRCLYLQPDHYEALCHLALLHEQGGNRSAAATLKARAARVFQRQQT